MHKNISTYNMISCNCMTLTWGLKRLKALTSVRLSACSTLEDRKKKMIELHSMHSIIYMKCIFMGFFKHKSMLYIIHIRKIAEDVTMKGKKIRNKILTWWEICFSLQWQLHYYITTTFILFKKDWAGLYK